MSEPETVTISTPGHAPVVIDAESAKRIRETCDHLLAELPGMEYRIVERCLDATRDLLSNHWDKISEIRDGGEEETVDIAVKFTVDCSGPTPKIVTKIAYAEKFKDEREDTLPDAKQPGLGLDKE
jgi:ERCC4-type nuclease